MKRPRSKLLDITAGKTPYGKLGESSTSGSRSAAKAKSEQADKLEENKNYSKNMKADVFGSPNFGQQWNTPSDKSKGEDS